MDISKLLTQYAQGQRDFHGLVLNQANLYRAELIFVNFDEVNLQKANLSYANLTGANLNHANLSSANLAHAILIGADLIRAKLAGANLSGVLMSGANLSGASLRNADLSNASLAGANLSGVDFANAILDNTNLEGADLSGADLSNTDLAKVNVRELNLEVIRLSEAQVARFSELNLIKASSFDDASDDTLEEYTEASEQYLLQSPTQYPAQIPDPFAEIAISDPEPGAYQLSQDLDQIADPFAEATSDLYPVIYQPSTDQIIRDIQTSDEKKVVIYQPSAQDDKSLVIQQPSTEYDKSLVVHQPPSNQIIKQDEIPEKSIATTSPVPQDDQANSSRKMLIGADWPEIPGQRHQDPSRSRNPSHRNEKIVQSLQSVLQRRVQYQFQKTLLETYNYQCAITGCNIRPLLEVILIAPENNENSDHPSNGLVLRTDLKILYKLHLISIDPTDLIVLTAPSLQDSEYSYLQGQKIFLTTDPAKRPDQKFLTAHLQACKWYTDSPQPITKEVQAVTPVSPKPLLQGLYQFANGAFRRTTKPMIAIGGVGILMLLGGVFWIGYYSRSEEPSQQLGSMVTDQRPMMAKGEVTPFQIKIDAVTYPQQGIVVDNSAYIPLTMTVQVGINPTELPLDQQLQHQGKSYLKAVYLNNFGVETRWDAKNRTMFLKGKSTLEIQPINLNIEGSEYAKAGLIIADTAYIPIRFLNKLKVDLDKIPGNARATYKDQDYFKAASLKKNNVSIDWDQKTRTLSLK
ncbi:MAG: pentapeptide repeat-containing protein [Leptolyngbyaceae bacterium]|nr:pentapeptide repeat-containing protein [Leptolyngbyaceae bacterium]